MTTFTPIDLSRLPPPDVIVGPEFETIFAEMLDDFRSRDPSFSAILESDPVVKLIEAAAYREVQLRQRINDAARAVMLATATGADLDHLAALYGVQRLVVDEGDALAIPARPQVLEEDARLRARTQLALEGFSTAGPVGAYIFHALSASARIKDVSVVSPQPGDVTVTVLSAKADGTPAYRETISALDVQLAGDSVAVEGRAVEDLIVAEGSEIRIAGADYSFDRTSSLLTRLPAGAIAADARLTLSFTRAAELQLAEMALTHEDVRPLTDRVTVQAAEIVAYAVEAELWIHDGPDTEVVRQTALEHLLRHLDELHRLGRDITLSGLYAALHRPGVQRVELRQPTATIVLDAHQAGFAQTVLVLVGGRDE